MGIQSQFFPALFASDRQNILANGIACINENAFSAKALGSFFITESDAIDKAAQNRIGNAGNDVLFLDQCRYTAETCG